MKQWLDERQIDQMIDLSYSLDNLDYENTIGVSRNTIADDQIGGVKIRINDLARKAKMHSRKLLIEYMIAGTANLSYDGVAYFATTHPNVAGNQSNLLTGSGVTAAKFADDFNAARAAMINFKDEKGNPYNEGVGDFLCVIPPGLQNIAEQVFNASLISSTTNVLKGAAKIMVSSRFTDVNDWYLAELSGAVKPFILQERQPVKFEALDKGTETSFLRKNYLFGVDWRGNCGGGLWQKCVKTINS